ncbi:ferric-chelate reductase [Coleophoma cylindrospora]|uniref:Ferric-chelate reductase n=1 Tax=Coleophoma cylindrospora TaxID=1849047 RepID=A0A3D8Q863_9HELO|nr:ferric-chelate reductase [Coleophoma cylindrospora]
MASLHLRHIANAADSNSTIVGHWGYVDRILPCTNDAGSCAYLDAVYWMHDISMLYTFIMWAVIGGIFVIAVALRFMKPVATRKSIAGPEAQKMGASSASYRAWRASLAGLRRVLLPESLTAFFGNVTRLQLLILAIVLAYLLVFSLVGIVYKTWITPVKAHPGMFNTRTGLGGFSDRVGALAYALTPLTIALASRESILSLATGIPYQSFNFLHRWLGRVIFVQSFIHTLGWTLIEGNFYKPQPITYAAFIKEKYIVWGIVAMALITFLYIFSLRSVIKRTGYEFFRKTHYVVAAVYIGACWAHWSHLACWMIAALGIWGIDRGLRLLRTLLIHVGYVDGSKGFGFHAAQASIKYFDDVDGGVIRLEYTHNHEAWEVGQHFFLCFPALSVWQSHPLTVASVPGQHPESPRHVYIIRCRSGETGRLKKLYLELASQPNADSKDGTLTTPVVMSGPYGSSLLPSSGDSQLPEPTNILTVAGGTGITLTLPLVQLATSSPALLQGAAVDLVWTIRRVSNADWIAQELEGLRKRAASSASNLRIHIFITQESSASSSATPSVSSLQEKIQPDTHTQPLPSSSSVSSMEINSQALQSSKNFSVTYLTDARPSIEEIVRTFVGTRAEPAFRTRVVASGPNEMGKDLRAAVAGLCDAGKVWKGDGTRDLELVWDDRMG